MGHPSLGEQEGSEGSEDEGSEDEGSESSADDEVMNDGSSGWSLSTEYEFIPVVFELMNAYNSGGIDLSTLTKKLPQFSASQVS